LKKYYRIRLRTSAALIAHPPFPSKKTKQNAFMVKVP
jgi:hypothetical protein